MPVFKMNDDGKAIDSEGNLALIDGEEITIEDAQNQPQFDAVLEKRLARQKEQVTRQKDQIQTLEAQQARTPALQSVIDNQKEDLVKLEAAVKDANSVAAQKVATQLDEANEGRTTAEKALSAEKVGRMHDQVTTQILSLGGDFINPAADLAPRLLAVHTQESVVDDAGKPTGKVVNRFELTFPDPENEGSVKTEKLPLEKAIQVVAALNPHYVKGNKGGGSGGSQYTPGARMITKMSQLKTRDEKIAFVGAHGREAFEKLTVD